MSVSLPHCDRWFSPSMPFFTINSMFQGLTWGPAQTPLLPEVILTPTREAIFPSLKLLENVIYVSFPVKF